MSDDVLGEYSVQRVAAWYRRLGQAYSRGNPDLEISLAGAFLLKWLDNRSAKSVVHFDAPRHLRSSTAVFEVLRYHRNVFMTYDRARIGSSEKYVGILPRLLGLPGFTKWDMHSELALSYESLCDIAPDPLAIWKIQRYGSSAERDLLGSLRGFQLRSEASFTGSMQGTRAIIRCRSWRCSATDRYDWNYSERLTVPNPDYKSKAEGAIAPDAQTLTVYHRNAKRLEDAGLAAPYDVYVRPWTVTDPRIVGDSGIETTRKL